MNVLVTGGAGYIGSILAEKLLEEKYQVVVIDNLQQGHREAVLHGAEFVLGDINDSKVLEKIFRIYKIDVVMHLAAETIVEYSMTDPKRYFKNNVVGGITLLNTMLKYDVHKIVFSSSAAVYGEPRRIPIDENHPKVPINSYGESKLIFERILQWYGRAYGLKHISLRYFNAAGASKSLGEDHNPESHLIPKVLKAALIKDPVFIFGTDYPTKDGSCIRDYVHVVDIANAHMLGLEKLDSLGGGAYNLGNGEGCSVLKVVNAAKKITNVDIPLRISPRRQGDPAILVAGADRARNELGWEPCYIKIESIIESAWEWMKRHPDGYKK